MENKCKWTEENTTTFLFVNKLTFWFGLWVELPVLQKVLKGRGQKDILFFEADIYKYPRSQSEYSLFAVMILLCTLICWEKSFRIRCSLSGFCDKNQEQ